MKKFLAIMIVVVMTAALCVSASALHHTSADQVMAGSDGHDLASFGGNNKDGTELGTITETEFIAWGWYSTEVEGGIVEFGYRYGEAVTLGSEKFIGGDAETIAAQCGGVGESVRFKVTVPVVKGDNVEVAIVASLADGTLDDIWLISYSAENGIDYPEQPEETQPEDTQPEDTQPEDTQPEDTQPEEPAETRELETVEEGKLNIVIDGGVERKEAKAGDEVEVKIQLKNNTKIASILTKLTWNEKLSLVSSKVDINDLVPAGGSSNALVVTKEEDPTTCNINWAYNNGQITEAECTYATLVFKVADNAAAGEFLEINAEIDPDNVFDEDMENVDFKLINGGIDVIGEEETQPEETQPEETQPEETGEATQPEETQGETNPNNPNTADIAIIAVASVAAVALAGAVIGKKALKK